MTHKTTYSLSLFTLLGAGALLACCAAFGSAAEDKTASVTPPQAAFFEAKVRPLLVENCYPCHSDKDQKGGLRLDSLEAARKGNASGPAVVPGDPDKSVILRVVHYDGAIKMPPGGKLKPEEIAALTEWIKMGAPWPDTKVPAAPATPEYIIRPAQKQFWSFQPVRKPALPKVKSTAWCKSPIDRFILAKLEAKGLKPAPPADRRTLIRRAYFDLIGLPPTPAEADAFVKDKSPDAFAKVVDHLLASPHYGERWGRHWLDLARYADSNGLDENTAFANAYRYRDYVINAFNQDKPYNQFIQEQLAGDLMPTDDPAIRNERLTATGFLSLGPKVLAEPDKPKLEMDIVDEQIEVTSKAFLGLTVTCARCHNHKFDPIPTKDYYALAGIFKSTRTMESLNTVARVRERPIDSPAEKAKSDIYAQKLSELQAAVKAQTDRADAELAANLHRDAGRYLLAGWRLAQHPSTEMESVAESPVKPGDPKRMIIEAENYDRGNANKNFDTYGKGIGVIHTVVVPTFAEWDITVPKAGPYQVELRYAAKESRPVHLLLNGAIVKTDAAGAVTGSWNPEGQRWEAQGIYAFQAGKNTLRIERNESIPHFDKLLVVPMTPPTGANGQPVLTPEQAASQFKLNAEVLKSCARYLRDRKDDPLFRGWQSLADVPMPAFDIAADKLGQRIQKGDEPDSAALRTALNDPKGPLMLPQKPEMFYSDAAKAAVKQAAEALKTAQMQAPKPPMVIAVEEGPITNVRVHIRGSTLNLGDEVPRHFLTIISGDHQTPIDDKHSGRLQLAQWLTRADNPLPARVMVNRIWLNHFGEGLVRTPDNFGFLGETPTHPELLDWLASTFVQQGWSFKKMHRLLMLSSAYQMSSDNSAQGLQVDPDNRLLWRMNLRRLDAEPFRDAILLVAGKLDETMGGSLLPTPDFDYVTNDQSGNAAQYSSPRRSVYLPVIRNALFDMFQAFDFGDPSTVHASRHATTVAPQALYMMNSPFVTTMAREFAAGLLADTAATDAARLNTAYLKAYARPPTPAEVKRALAYLSSYSANFIQTEPDAQKRRKKAWESLCQILFASNEFIYVN